MTNNPSENLYFKISALGGLAAFINKLLDVVIDPVREGRHSGEH